ncbi:hypothetical protein JCM19992_18590 [Thermostilla marina]
MADSAKKVLLCDDELPILKAAQFKLQRAGYTVLTAGDGEEGWEIIERESPAIVVTDYQMPRLDGLGLIRRMREHDSTRDVPTILLTAKGFELEESELREQYGVSALVAKPFSPRHILSLVEEIIGPVAATA